ncbi:hypothetical protein [Paludisphaera mucosa]|uniref:DoxX family protein n=1 Tax=Paludisphaera mucosa TaxID=3030827 RepID=A0ABT6FHX0_9BACT|nr:hypothetical protein [Paludisphaera mucosa]MDG3006985.1 hypothetical protein [Paludisphaera mucosa]
MSLLRTGSHRTVPFLMLLVGLALIGSQAYQAAGPDAAQFAVKGSLQKLLLQIPAGIVAVIVASRLIDCDFGPITVVALKLAGIMVLAEGVGCWVPFPFFSAMAELAVMVVGFFWLFELGKWETYLVVLLNLAAIFGARYLVDQYMSPSHPYWITNERPRQGRRR